MSSVLDRHLLNDSISASYSCLSRNDTMVFLECYYFSDVGTSNCKMLSFYHPNICIFYSYKKFKSMLRNKHFIMLPWYNDFSNFTYETLFIKKQKKGKSVYFFEDKGLPPKSINNFVKVFDDSYVSFFKVKAVVDIFKTNKASARELYPYDVIESSDVAFYSYKNVLNRKNLKSKITNKKKYDLKIDCFYKTN